MHTYPSDMAEYLWMHTQDWNQWLSLERETGSLGIQEAGESLFTTYAFPFCDFKILHSVPICIQTKHT